jgi:peptidyl-Lys metalloendopeptidase
VRLLRWYVPGTPGLKTELLEVTRDGEAVEYIGPHIKRAAPGAEDFITLAPGESFSGVASLSDLYDLRESGTYSVRFAAQSVNQHNVGLTRAANLDSNLVSLWIEGRASREPAYQAQAVTAQGLTAASNCTSTRASQIVTAVASAKTYASSTLSYLNGISSGTARYTTWFGTFSSGNLSTARSHFTNINSHLNTATVSVDCGCTDSSYAYVYPTQPTRIYVCSAFWSAPNTGTDSKAGTLIHETSHFNVVAGTDDNAYGQSAAKSLAKSSPTKALDNADSHEYIAENNPAQN